MRLDSNWYNLNRHRPFPLDEGATLHDDDGGRLPSGVLVDLQLAFPDDAGYVPYVAAVKVSDKLVSVVLAAAQDPDTSGQFVPLAAATVSQPVSLGKHYPLEALYPGVAGYVVFGDAEIRYQGRFSSPSQSRLSPHVFRTFRRPGVLSVRKQGAEEAFRGLVRLRGAGEMEVVAESRTPPGQSTPQTVAVFRLKLDEGGYSLLEKYAGPCGVRPDSDNCPVPPLETVGGVAPDCNGNVVLDFRGMTTTDLTDSNGTTYGLAVDYGRDLDDVCPPIEDDPLRDPSSGSAAIMGDETIVSVRTYDFGQEAFEAYQHQGSWYYLPGPEYWLAAQEREAGAVINYLEADADQSVAHAWFAAPTLPGRVDGLRLDAELVVTEPGEGGLFVLPPSRSGRYIWFALDSENWIAHLKRGTRVPRDTVWAATLTDQTRPCRLRLSLRLSRGQPQLRIVGQVRKEEQVLAEFDQELPYASPSAYCGIFVTRGRLGFQSLRIETEASR